MTSLNGPPRWRWGGLAWTRRSPAPCEGTGKPNRSRSPNMAQLCYFFRGLCRICWTEVRTSSGSAGYHAFEPGRAPPTCGIRGSGPTALPTAPLLGVRPDITANERLLEESTATPLTSYHG